VLTRREREKLAHRNMILDAAERIFSKKGFYSATLDEIAQESEFSKGALYIYFSSKEDILYNIIKEKGNLVSGLLTKTLKGEKSFKEELRDFYVMTAELAFNEHNFFSMLLELQIGDFKPISCEKTDEIKAKHQEYIDFVMNRVIRAKENGELRDVNYQTVCGLIHGVSHNMVLTHWQCETVDELKNAAESFIDILFNGIGKSKENLVS